MSGELPESNVRAKEKEVSAGVVPVGSEQSATMQVRNNTHRLAGCSATACHRTRVQCSASGGGCRSRPRCNLYY